MRRSFGMVLVMALALSACAGAELPDEEPDGAVAEVEPAPEGEAETESPEEAEPEPEEAPEREPEPEVADEAPAEIELRMTVSDDTSEWDTGTSGLPDVEVWVRGTGSWFPDTSFGSDTIEDAGPFPVGEVTEFAIYPDGRDGTEIMVEVLPDEDMIGGSPRDAIDITIDDTTVNVFGTPIPGLEVEFPR